VIKERVVIYDVSPMSRNHVSGTTIHSGLTSVQCEMRQLWILV